MILAILFLIFSIAFGYAVVRAIGFAESHEEELAAAIALGLPLSACLSFALFLAVGGAAPFASIVVEAALVLVALSKKELRIRQFKPTKGFLIRFTPLFVVLALFFANGAMHFDARGNLIVSPEFYGDAYYHVSIMQYYSFSGGEAAPLQDPQYAGAPVGYPFLTDFYSAMLQRLGFDFALAFVVPAFVMITAFYAIFYFFALRLSRNRNAAFCATALLFFSATLAYPIMLEDAQKQGLRAWLSRPERDYAALEENGKLGNTVQFTKSYLVAQRSADFGYPVALVVFALLFEVVRKENARNEKIKRRMLLTAGVLAGLTPLMRETAFYACVAVAAFLALLFVETKSIKKWFARWTLFFAPCFLLAAPQLPFIIGGAANEGYISVALGWKAHSANPLKIAWFWLRNLGLPVLFAVAGFALARRDVKKYYLAFLPLFLIVNVFSFTPDPLNNMKIVNFWEMPTFVLAGVALGVLWKNQIKSKLELFLAVVAATLLFVAILPGALSLWRDYEQRLVIYSSEDYEFARWANEALPANATLLSFGGPHALDLVGRARVSGFPAVGWIKGRSDWYVRVLAVRDFFAGRKQCEVARRYSATHAVVTQSERSFEEFNASAFQRNPVLWKIYERRIGALLYEVYEIHC
ncbi:MAG: hypothetical protein QW343_02195 [Candidatus Norongarragalinales archaeon]